MPSSRGLEVDRSGEWSCPEAPPDVEDCYNPEKPMGLLGQRTGEFLEPEELLAAMAAEDAGLHAPSDLEDKLKAGRDRHTSSLSREQ